jgi:hypothetical protein
MDTTEVLGRLHDFLSHGILFVVLGILCAGFAAASFVLLFHWSRYALDKSVIVKAKAFFFLGGGFIILIGLVSVILY